MTDWISKLEQAKRLLEAGALTPAEFDAEKLKLLPSTTSVTTGLKPALSGEALKRRKPLAPMMIALGVIALLLALGTAVFHFTRLPKPVVRPRDVSSLAASPGPSTETSIQIPNQAAAAVEPQPGVGRERCGSQDLVIDVPGVGTSGSIVINYPLDDTDGMGSLRLEAGPYVCVTPAQISKFATPGPSAETASDVLVSFSPTGSAESALNYSAMMCSELPETPKPPRDLRIGTFSWLGQSEPVSVTWHSDYRAHMESACLCDDGGSAPCSAG